ncbi:hypothetical protein P8452_76795 [Trifolium repens]|nr:hypothetical protein P8452_76795 [Trifolium repens]
MQPQLKKRVHYKTVTNPSPIERNTIPVFFSTKCYSVLFRFYSRKLLFLFQSQTLHFFLSRHLLLLKREYLQQGK